MITLYDSNDFGAILGVELTRWYFGASYESWQMHRAAVLRFGPLYLHLIVRRSDEGS